VYYTLKPTVGDWVHHHTLSSCFVRQVHGRRVHHIPQRVLTAVPSIVVVVVVVTSAGAGAGTRGEHGIAANRPPRVVACFHAGIVTAARVQIHHAAAALARRRQVKLNLLLLLLLLCRQ